MNNNELKNTIADKVLERIRGGKAHMHSREYFFAWATLTAVVAVFALAVSIFVISFVFFSVHESGELFLLGFGVRGIQVFLSLFPWIELILDIAILLFLEWLLQGFKIGYRVSLLNIFVGMLALSIIGALLVNVTPLHSTLLDRADQRGLPVIGDMYESIRDSHQDKGVFRGTITSLQNNMLIISHDDHDHDQDDGMHTVLFNVGTMSAEDLHVGDRVYVFGATTSDGTIQAYGIRKLSPTQ